MEPVEGKFIPVLWKRHEAESKRYMQEMRKWTHIDKAVCIRSHVQTPKIVINLGETDIYQRIPWNVITAVT
jgi:hypothetical protein